MLQSSFPDNNVHFCTKTAFEFITIIEWDHKFNRFLLPKLKKNEYDKFLPVIPIVKKSLGQKLTKLKIALEGKQVNVKRVKNTSNSQKQSKGVLSFEKPFKCLSSHAVLDTEVLKICTDLPHSQIA